MAPSGWGLQEAPKDLNLGGAGPVLPRQRGSIHRVDEIEGA